MARGEFFLAAEAALLARPEGVWLTAEQRDLVLRALRDVGPTEAQAVIIAGLEASVATYREKTGALEAQLETIRAALNGLSSAVNQVSPAAPTTESIPPRNPVEEPAGDSSRCVEGCLRKGTPHAVCKITDDADTDAGAAEVHESLATTGELPEASWDGGAIDARAHDVEVLGHTARFVDFEGNDLQLIGDLHDPAIAALAMKARRRLQENRERTAKEDAEPRWGRTDEKSAWHLWRGAGAGEAECGETTAEDFPLLPNGERPPANEVCVDCADTIGWTEPTEQSRPTEPTPQGLLALSDPPAEKGPCAVCEKPTRRSPLVDASDLRPCFKPYVGKRLCFEHEKESALAGALAETTCESPGCELAGEQDPETGGRFCMQFHYSVEKSIRLEWHLAKHPELKPKADKTSAIKPKKQRRKSAEAAHG